MEDARLMRQVFLCILLLLALPQVVGAGELDLGPDPLMVTGRAFESAAEPAAAARELDLGFDGAQLRFAQDAPDDDEGGDAPPAKGDTSPYEAQADRGLSFDFEIKPRSRYGALARKDEAGDPDLDDHLDKLIERPVFGFRGRYRF